MTVGKTAGIEKTKISGCVDDTRAGFPGSFFAFVNPLYAIAYNVYSNARAKSENTGFLNIWICYPHFRQKTKLIQQSLRIQLLQV
jgi:hypothetical protein